MIGAACALGALYLTGAALGAAYRMAVRRMLWG